MRLLCGLAMLVAWLGPLALAQDVVVSKEAGRHNPRLAIRNYSGAPSLRARLEADLRYSDWFDLVPNQNNAEYVLDYACGSVAEGIEAIVQLSDVSGNAVCSFRQQARGGGDPRWLVHGSIDGLIRRVFNTPGFCTSRLAFVRDSHGVKEVWIADFDGSNAEQITFNRGISTEPDWGPESRTLVYTLYSPFATNVAMIDIPRRRHKLVSTERGLNSSAALSPDGNRLALSLNVGNDVVLCLKDLGSGKLRRLTGGSDPGVEASPCWSPDGRRICFVTDKYGTRPTVLIASVDGSAPAARLLPGLTEAVSPTWSPDGKTIAFSLRQGSQYVLATVEIGRPDSLKILTDAAGDWEAPCWAADGRHLVCTRRLQGSASLYLVDSSYGRCLPLAANGNGSLPAYSRPLAQ